MFDETNDLITQVKHELNPNYPVREENKSVTTRIVVQKNKNVIDDNDAITAFIDFDFYVPPLVRKLVLKLQSGPTVQFYIVIVQLFLRVQ